MTPSDTDGPGPEGNVLPYASAAAFRTARRAIACLTNCLTTSTDSGGHQVTSRDGFHAQRGVRSTELQWIDARCLAVAGMVTSGHSGEAVAVTQQIRLT